MRLRELRLEKGLTLVALAEKLHTSHQVLSRYENELREPDINMLTALATFFGCSIDYLVGRSDDFGNVATDADLNEIEKQLLEKFRLLPEIRQKTIIDTISFMVESFKSTKQKNG